MDKIKSFFIRKDADYSHYSEQYQAQSLFARFFYLLMYLLPGIAGYLLINNIEIYETMISITGLSSEMYQYVIIILVTFGWHILLPLLSLKFVDKLAWGEIWKFLNLNRFDWKGMLLIMPIVLLATFFISIPYMKFLGTPFEGWLNSIPIFRVPDHSIFCCYEKIYGYPAIMLLFLFIGNFLGEELYYRGYLMKKTAFLGKWNWVINALLFTIYHFWQIPQTYPYILLVAIFPLMMIWRKNLYVVIVMHLLWNLLYPLFMSFFYYQ